MQISRRFVTGSTLLGMALTGLSGLVLIGCAREGTAPGSTDIPAASPDPTLDPVVNPTPTPVPHPVVTPAVLLDDPDPFTDPNPPKAGNLELNVFLHTEAARAGTGSVAPPATAKTILGKVAPGILAKSTLTEKRRKRRITQSDAYLFPRSEVYNPGVQIKTVTEAETLLAAHPADPRFQKTVSGSHGEVNFSNVPNDGGGYVVGVQANKSSKNVTWVPFKAKQSLTDHREVREEKRHNPFNEDRIRGVLLETNKRKFYGDEKIKSRCRGANDGVDNLDLELRTYKDGTLVDNKPFSVGGGQEFDKEFELDLAGQTGKIRQEVVVKAAPTTLDDCVFKYQGSMDIDVTQADATGKLVLLNEDDREISQPVDLGKLATEGVYAPGFRPRFGLKDGTELIPLNYTSTGQLEAGGKQKWDLDCTGKDKWGANRTVKLTLRNHATNGTTPVALDTVIEGTEVESSTPPPITVGTSKCYPTEVVSYNPGPSKNGSNANAPIPTDRANPLHALEQGVDEDKFNFVSLGFGGNIVLKFKDRIPTAGNYLKVVETSFGSPTCNKYPEHADVAISQDGETWTNLGTICQDGTFDLDGQTATWYQFVKVTDKSEMKNFGKRADGFDVNSVETLCGFQAVDSETVISVKLNNHEMQRYKKFVGGSAGAMQSVNREALEGLLWSTGVGEGASFEVSASDEQGLDKVVSGYTYTDGGGNAQKVITKTATVGGATTYQETITVNMFTPITADSGGDYNFFVETTDNTGNVKTLQYKGQVVMERSKGFAIIEDELNKLAPGTFFFQGNYDTNEQVETFGGAYCKAVPFKSCLLTNTRWMYRSFTSGSALVAQDTTDDSNGTVPQAPGQVPDPSVNGAEADSIDRQELHEKSATPIIQIDAGSEANIRDQVQTIYQRHKAPGISGGWW